VVYAKIPHGARLVAATGALPWRYEHLTDYQYGVSPGLLFDLDPHDIRDALSVPGRYDVSRAHPRPGQQRCVALRDPSDWLEADRTRAADNSGFRIVYRNPDA